jgi:hypothetical protein
MNKTMRGCWAAALAAIMLAGCGGGGDGTWVPAIGPAGGTVTGANGATIVVPPGALTQEVELRITEIDPAAATLPVGVERVSAVYALTPHGTAFAVPVTVTIPFDPAKVPTGRSVQFLKTTDAAQAVWADAAGAAAGGNTISASVSSFSHAMAAMEQAQAPVPGWATMGGDIVKDEPVRLGGLAVSSGGKVAVAYVVGASGTAGLVGELRVSQWDETTQSWVQLGRPLTGTGDAPSLGSRSIVYDKQGNPVVAWLDRLKSVLVVQRWTGSTWDKLGMPVFSAAAATGVPQIAVDPLNNRPNVVIASGPYVTVREWIDGSPGSWSAGVSPMATTLSGAILTIPSSGQRLLATAYGDDVGGTKLLARLFTADSAGRFVDEFGPPIGPMSFDASRFVLDLDTDGSGLFALIGAHSDAQSVGELFVRRLSNGVWISVGGNLADVAGFRNGSIQFRVTPSALPVLAYMEQLATPVLSRRIGGLWWDGLAWQTAPDANDASVESAETFALGLGPTGLPYVALALRNPDLANTNPYAQQLVVRRLEAVTLSVIVDGPLGSGAVTGSGQRCEAGASCDLSVPAGTPVTLVAEPATGFNLQSWVGCDSVVALRCEVTVNGSQAVTATFE